MSIIRYRERGNIEAHFFNLQSQLKSSGQKVYAPPEGKLVSFLKLYHIILKYHINIHYI